MKKASIKATGEAIVAWAQRQEVEECDCNDHCARCDKCFGINEEVARNHDDEPFCMDCAQDYGDRLWDSYKDSLHEEQ